MDVCSSPTLCLGCMVVVLIICKVHGRINCGREYRDCIRRNGDKIQMYSTCYSVLDFMGTMMT